MNGGQRFKVQAVEIRYLRGTCGLIRIDSESKESVYGKFGMSSKSEGLKCGVVIWSLGENFKKMHYCNHMTYKSGVETVDVKGETVGQCWNICGWRGRTGH